MKLLLDIQNDLFRKIQRLIESGNYSSISDFFIIAAENQILLENTSSEKSSEVISTGIKILSHNKISVENKEELLLVPKKELLKTVKVPEAKQLLYPNTQSENELFIWGQINRIFPLKVGLRVLANLLAEKSDSYIGLEEFRTEAAQVAQKVRRFLVKKTLKITGKKDSLWAGLPADSEKSVVRYKSQFLAYLRKDDIIEGGLGRLKFVNLVRKENKGVFIGITDLGLDFCLLENPVLDNGSSFKDSLCYAEKEYYINHIKQHIPGEARSFGEVLRLINNNVLKVFSLNSQLKETWPKGWSEAVINTQRNGIISRLVELGLVEKNKIGVEVEYRISDNGKIFLNCIVK